MMVRTALITRSNIGLCHFGVDGQRYDTIKHSTSIRKIFAAMPKGLLVVRVEVQRNKMDTGSDALLVKKTDELTAGNAQLF